MDELLFVSSSVSTCLLAALCESVLQPSCGIKRGSDYGLLLREVFQGGTYETRMSDTLRWLVKTMIDGAE